MHRFYRRDAGAPPVAPVLPAGYEVRYWQPARDGLPSPPLPAWPNAVWWGFDRFGIFGNHGSGVITITRQGRIAHRSLVTAGWFRFPEMARDDLQIGDTWTDPADRGRGLAAAAVMLVLGHWAGSYGRMWYIVEDDNAASIRVIEKCGFSLVGTGARTRPLGLSPLGQFRIERPV